jgi:energy-coupling factor transporter ATP-binding protein EcfA2
MTVSLCGAFLILNGDIGSGKTTLSHTLKLLLKIEGERTNCRGRAVQYRNGSRTSWSSQPNRSVVRPSGGRGASVPLSRPGRERRSQRSTRVPRSLTVDQTRLVSFRNFAMFVQVARPDQAGGPITRHGRHNRSNPVGFVRWFLRRSSRPHLHTNSVFPSLVIAVTIDQTLLGSFRNFAMLVHVACPERLGVSVTRHSRHNRSNPVGFVS